MKALLKYLILSLFAIVANPMVAQTVNSPETQREIPLSTDLEAAALYFEANFPATYEIIWSNLTPDIVKASQVDIARVLIKTLGHPNVAGMLSSRLQTDFPEFLASAMSATSEEWLRQGNVLATEVGKSVAESLAIKATAALSTDLLFQTPPMKDTHPQLEGPLRIVIETTIVEMYDAQKALKDPSVLLGKFLDRYYEMVEIYHSTLLVASTQKQALTAAVLANEAAAIAAAEIGGERGAEIISRAIRYIEIAPISQAVGLDDAEAVDGILLMGLQALYAYHRGEEVLARQQAEIVRQLGNAGANIHPFSAVTKPLDWAVAVINMGKDSPEIAAELYLGSTALANLFDPPPAEEGSTQPEQILYSSLPDAEVYREYEKTFSEEKVTAIVNSVTPSMSLEVAEKFAWAASEVFLANIRASRSAVDIAYDRVMAFASGLEREERAYILILSVLDQIAAEQGLTINDFQLLNDGRNMNQSEILSFIPELSGIEGRAGWELRPSHESVFHAFGYDPSDLRKYTHSAGCEYIFRRVGDGWEFLNDGVNTGTFNYSNEAIAHTLLDVFPWIIWGAGAEERRTFDERLRLAQENGVASQISTRIQAALNDDGRRATHTEDFGKCGSRLDEPDIIWRAVEETTSEVPTDPNALFVEAVTIYRGALTKSGDEQAAAFGEVRDSFDQIVEYFPETRQAQAIEARSIPSIDFTLLYGSTSLSAADGPELGLEAGLYAIDPALCAVSVALGAEDGWGGLFQKISADKIQRSAERECQLSSVDAEGDLLSISAECSVEGEVESDSWLWRRVSDAAFSEVEGINAGKSFTRCVQDELSTELATMDAEQVDGQVQGDPATSGEPLYVQTHSRQDFDEALRIAQELAKSGAPNVNVFTSANGWIAITAITVAAGEATDAKLQDLIATYGLPADSLFTSGQNFTELRASFEGHDTRPSITAASDSKDAMPQQAAASVNTSVAPKTRVRSSGCIRMLPYPEIRGPDHPSRMRLDLNREADKVEFIDLTGNSAGQKLRPQLQAKRYVVFETTRHTVIGIQDLDGNCIGVFRGYAKYPGDGRRIDVERSLRGEKRLIADYPQLAFQYNPLPRPGGRSLAEVEAILASEEDVRWVEPKPGIEVISPSDREFDAELVDEEFVRKTILGLVDVYEDIDLTRFNNGIATTQPIFDGLGEDAWFNMRVQEPRNTWEIRLNGDHPARGLIHYGYFHEDKATALLGIVEETRILDVSQRTGGDCEWEVTYRAWLRNVTDFGRIIAGITSKEGYTTQACFRLTRKGMKMTEKRFLDW